MSMSLTQLRGEFQVTQPMAASRMGNSTSHAEYKLRILRQYSLANHRYVLYCGLYMCSRALSSRLCGFGSAVA